MPWNFFIDFGAPADPPVLGSVPAGFTFMWTGALAGPIGTTTEALTLYDSVPSYPYLVCNGALVPIAGAFNELYNKLTNNGVNFPYGANSGSGFRLPDMTVRIPVGQDAGDTDFDTIGEQGGSTTHTHTLADHTHTLPNHQHQLLDHNHFILDHAHTIPAHTHSAGVYNDNFRCLGFGSTGTSQNNDQELIDLSPNVNGISAKVHGHGVSGRTGGISPGTGFSDFSIYGGPLTGNPLTAAGGPVLTNALTGPASTGALEDVPPYNPKVLTLNSVGNDSIPPYSVISYIIAI